MPSLIRAAYERRIQSGELNADPAQKPAVAALMRLERDLARKAGPFRRAAPVKGLYLWGPPGRGKSLLMDLFFAETPEPRKARAHFHAFMARVHDLIRQWREGGAKQRKAVFGRSVLKNGLPYRQSWGGDDPIAPVAALIASEARLLCFDELQVTDIADAMILGRLFQALFAQGVVLAVTSNRAPEDLYANGINRQLFLPFIDVIRERCEVVELTGERDWRLHRMRGHRTWLSPLDDAARAEFEAFWSELKGGAPEAPAHLAVKGRDVVVDRTAGGLARATFAELCARPLGASDYLALADRFHTLFLEGVPILGPHNHHEARRLVTLIDALYEARTRLVVSAEAAPERLYIEGVGAFEFERTVSRLNQMSGADWLTAPDAA